MVLYSITIYDRNGNCVFYQEHNKEDSSGNILPTRKQNKPDDVIAEQKLMYGLLFSLKAFTNNISPKPSKTFHSYTTSTYKLHYYESPTGYKFVLLTDPGVGSIVDSLKHIYRSIFVPYISNNTLYQVQTGNKIDCHLFIENLNSYLKASNWYS